MSPPIDRIVIVAHGQPSAPGPQEGYLIALGHAVSGLLGLPVQGCTLAAPGALELALSGARAPLIYPLFMADGWFTRRELPRRLSAAGQENAQQLPPFGADPGLQALIQAQTTGARHLLLTGHGSQRATTSIATCEAMAQRLRDSGAYDQVVTGYVEQAPFITDAARQMGQGVCLPFFALEARHVTDDLPEAMANSGFDGPLLPPLGRAAETPALIAAAIRAALPAKTNLPAQPPRLSAALAAIDAANAPGPDQADLIYGQRMSAELALLHPQAAEPLQIACRGQHIERWMLPRADFPEGRAGYLAWRREQGRRHADRVCQIMAECGYDSESCDAAGRMLRKEAIKRDPQVQALEDVACMSFLRWYAGDFLGPRDEKSVERIVNLTARKMSAEGRAAALATFDLPEAIALHFRD